MTLSLTDRLQQDRVMVVEVDPVRGRVRVKGERCSDLACHERTVVITEDGAETSLEALNPGDVIRVDEDGTAAPGVARIVVLRRVWEQIASPEL
jgi:hypothetical protein